MTTFYDMHCHLDFANNSIEVAAAAQQAGLTALCSTVVPSSFVAAREEFKPYPNMHIALGAHPWWIAQDRISEVDLNRFEMLAQETPYIGEIGLDFHSKRGATREQQEAVLYRILNAINETGDRKLVFLHGVRAADTLIGMLEKCQTASKHVCVFHWFQGTPDDFGRALADDCWFSVGMRMLATDAGRMFAKAVPDERLLIETDNPPHEGMAWDIGMWIQELENTLHDLAELREVDPNALAETLAANSSSLLVH